MLVPLDEWAASSAATIEIIQFPCQTPRGGTFGFPKSVLAPAPKTWPKTVFGTKHLSDLIFFDTPRVKKYGPTGMSAEALGFVLCRVGAVAMPRDVQWLGWPLAVFVWPKASVDTGA
jgi:hypothetical protein